MEHAPVAAEAGFQVDTGMTEEDMQADWGKDEGEAGRLFDPAGAARRAVPMQHIEEAEGDSLEEGQPKGLPFNKEAAALLRAAAEIQATPSGGSGGPAAANVALAAGPSPADQHVVSPRSPRGNHSFRKDPAHPPHRSEFE